MSYGIIYDAFTIKQDNNYFVFTIAGSNNVFEVSWNGRQKRERSFNHICWLLKKEFKNKITFSYDEVLNINSFFDIEELKKEYSGGNIQGISINSVIKRVKEKSIDNKELNAKTQISSFYYFLDKDLSEKDKELAENLRVEYNNKINKLLNSEEREKIFYEFRSKLNKNLKERFDKYFGKNFYYFFYDKIDKLYLNYILNKFKTRRKQKIWDWNKIKSLSDYAEEITEKDVEKKGFLFEGDIFIGEGRIRKTFSGNLGFFKKRVRRYYTPIRIYHKFLSLEKAKQLIEVE